MRMGLAPKTEGRRGSQRRLLEGGRYLGIPRNRGFAASRKGDERAVDHRRVLLSVQETGCGTNGATWGNIRTAFERACKEAKIEDFRFHDLRHTCASWLVMRGRSLKEVQELLGHRTFAMTLRYAYLSPDRLREAVASLERPAPVNLASDPASVQHKVSTKQAHELTPASQTCIISAASR